MATCKIVIIDEANCKLSGLETSTRKKLVNKFKYEIPGARFTPAVRLGRWDGKIGFFSLGGVTYINLLADILPILESEGYNIELEDTRDYLQSFDFTRVKEDDYADRVWPKNHKIEGQPVMLRDDQVSAINLFLENLQGIQCLATGFGKSLLTAVLSHKVEAIGRSIVIVPSQDLVKQTAAEYANLGLDVGLFYGGQKDYTKTHTICTWQSLNSLFKSSKEGDTLITFDDFLKDVVCVIVDECFSGETKVLTPNGYKQIKDIKPGDKVINFNEKTQEFKEDTVVSQHKNLIKSDSAKMLRLTTDSGAIIEVTDNHKFLTTVGWIEVKDLTENHDIISVGIKAAHYCS